MEKNRKHTNNYARKDSAESGLLASARIEPFYDEFCVELSEKLLDVDRFMTKKGIKESEIFNDGMLKGSWFSVRTRYQRNWVQDQECLKFFMNHGFEENIEVPMLVSRKIRIYPTRVQRNKIAQWFGISRMFYNDAVKYYGSDEEEKEGWMKHYDVIASSHTQDYVQMVPYQIKKMAVRDANRAYSNSCKKAKKTGERFKLKLRKRKDPYQSCYIPKSSVFKDGIYPRILGKMKIKEPELITEDHSDSRLVKEHGAWYIVVPVKLERKTRETSENQGRGDVVALDPGVRSFLTYFSENGCFGRIGVGFQRLVDVSLKIDHLQSKYALAKNAKDRKRVRRLYRLIGKKRLRLIHLADELHWKAANFLVRNFSVIILPTYCTSEMVRKPKKEGDRKRKFDEGIARAMLSLGFYKFSERLANKCAEYGVKLIRCCEAYTSQTNSFTGESLPNLKKKKWFSYNGFAVERDLNGARNILLRAMRDGSAVAGMPRVV